MLYPVPMESKNMSQDLCKGMLFFDGDVAKDKSTKQKIPIGHGKLFVKGYDGYNIVDNIAIIGDFDGQSVKNASFCINDNGECNWNNEYNKHTIRTERVFNGQISYNYSYDRDTKKLYLTVNLLEGELFSIPSNSKKNVQITPEDNLQYKMSFEKSDRVPYNRRFNVNPLTIRNTSNNNTDYTDAVFSILNPIIEENYWEATNTGDWEIKWIGGKLINGLNLKVLKSKSSDGTCLDFKIEGENGVNAHSDGNAGKLPLSDGGYLSWTDWGKSMQLHYPTGEIYSGTFDKIPFTLDYINGSCSSELFANAAKSIIESSASDFVIGTGTFISSTGKSERVKDGRFIDRLLNNRNNSDSLDYATLISGAKILSDNYDDYKALCKRDFWEYIGKGNISELDKELYKKTPEYKLQYKAYQEALDGLYYEVVACYANDFSTKGASIYKKIDLGESEARALPLLPIDRDNWWQSALPLKSSCVTSGNVSWIKIPITSTDIDFLRYLQSSGEADELALLCIMKPGITIEYNPYDAVPTAVGLYLINKTTNAILEDFCKYLDTTDPNKYKAIFEQINIKDKAKYKSQVEAQKKDYQRRYGKNASPCPSCAGTGSLTYWGSGGSYKKTCGSCGGTGRIYKR